MGGGVCFLVFFLGGGEEKKKKRHIGGGSLTCMGSGGGNGAVPRKGFNTLVPVNQGTKKQKTNQKRKKIGRKRVLHIRHNGGGKRLEQRRYRRMIMGGVKDQKGGK